MENKIYKLLNIRSRRHQNREIRSRQKGGSTATLETTINQLTPGVFTWLQTGPACRWYFSFPDHPGAVVAPLSRIYGGLKQNLIGNTDRLKTKQQNKNISFVTNITALHTPVLRIRIYYFAYPGSKKCPYGSGSRS